MVLRRPPTLRAPWLRLLTTMAALWFAPGPAGADPGPLTAEETCAAVGGKLSSVSAADCLSFRMTKSGESRHGRAILLKEYPPLKQRPPQARVLVLGGVHGDEYSSVSIVFKWMKQLDAHHSGLFHWMIAPLVNPDGLLQPVSQRVNAAGVDLNRNFETPDWQAQSRDYWQRQTGSDPRRFPGHAPLSEPESRWMKERIDAFKPHAIVSIHAPYGLLDFDGPPTTPPKRLGRLTLSPMGTFPGSLGRYAGLELKIPVITIELENAGVLPPPAEVQEIWSDLIRWLRTHVHASSSPAKGK
ncbi:MAG: murein peptide amidase A [Magnetococcales bacterium]|nr:murein peptide amidase A [Magnetococcales bacterium]